MSVRGVNMLNVDNYDHSFSCNIIICSKGGPMFDKMVVRWESGWHIGILRVPSRSHHSRHIRHSHHHPRLLLPLENQPG